MWSFNVGRVFAPVNEDDEMRASTFTIMTSGDRPLFHRRGGRVRGVLLWNVWEQVGAARKLIAELGPTSPATLEGRLTA